MATAHHEHDHGNCKADCKHTHQRTPLNSGFPGQRGSRPLMRGAGAHLSAPTSFRRPAPRPARRLFLRRGSRSVA
jgi:hypothetical protein